MLTRLTIIAALLLAQLACREVPRPISSEQWQRLGLTRERLRTELGSKYDKAVAPATKAQLQRGAELFGQICGPCHGPRGKADGLSALTLSERPSDLTDPRQANFFSEQARLHIIRQGSPGTAMAAWGAVLSENDIVAVYLYVRSLIEEE